MTDKPVWKYTIPLEEFKAFCSHLPIVAMKVITHCEAEDRWNYNTVLIDKNNKELPLPRWWMEVFEFNANSRSLLGFTWKGREMRDALHNINYWLEKNQEELDLYKKLKEKFESLKP